MYKLDRSIPVPNFNILHKKHIESVYKFRISLVFPDNPNKTFWFMP